MTESSEQTNASVRSEYHAFSYSDRVRIFMQKSISNTPEAVGCLEQVLRIDPEDRNAFRAEFSPEIGFLYSTEVLSHTDLVVASNALFSTSIQRGEGQLVEMQIKNEVSEIDSAPLRRGETHIEIEVNFFGEHDTSEINSVTNNILALTRESANIARDNLPIVLHLQRPSTTAGGAFRERFYSGKVGYGEFDLDNPPDLRQEPRFLQLMKKIREKKSKK